MLRFSSSDRTPFLRRASGVLLGSLALAPALLFGQSGSAASTTSLSATGTGPYTFTATVTGHNLAAPTGSVTFADQTAARSLGNASLGSATTTQSFGSQTTYPTDGVLPFSVAVGDFNADGHPDLAVTNVESNNVSILLGKGDGTFQPPVTYGVGDAPHSVAVGDFNGDGHLDLAVANNGDNSASVLLGKGDGTFQAPVTYAVGDAPSSVAVGDFNGDGHLDLAVATKGDNSASVLPGNGDGTFQPQIAYFAGEGPSSVAVGDFNGDGHPDLAIANDDASVSVLLSKGDGTFQLPKTIPLGGNPNSVAVGDFNGDGHLDLAVANYESNNVMVLLNLGDGTFQSQPTDYPVGYNPNSVAVGDFNGDGHPDLAVANYDGTVSVLLNQGNGTFPSQAASYQAGGEPFSVAVGDFNSDGVPDLAVANLDSNNLSVLLNKLAHTATATLPNVAVIGTGSHTINAGYPGDSKYAASSGTVSVAASLVSATLTLAVPSTATAGQNVQLAASLSPYAQDSLTAAGSVTFSSGSGVLGSAPLTNGTATLTVSFPTAGMQTIQARYIGDSNFASAASNPQAITVTPASTFILTPYPSTEYQIKRGRLGGFLLELQPVNGFQGNVRLSCSGGPAGSYCANLPQTVNLKGTAFAVSGLYFPPGSAPGTYTITFTGISGSTTVTATAKFIVK